MITCFSKNLVIACSIVRVRVAADVAEDLVYLYELPDGAVVHHDVNPTNVLLNNGRAGKACGFRCIAGHAVGGKPRVHWD